MPSKVGSSPFLIFFCIAPRDTPANRAARDTVRSCDIRWSLTHASGIYRWKHILAQSQGHEKGEPAAPLLRVNLTPKLG